MASAEQSDDGLLAQEADGSGGSNEQADPQPEWMTFLAERREDEVVALWVGDRCFKLLRSTLLKYQGSMLEAMFSGDFWIPRDTEGNYLLEGDADIFQEVLYFLQRGRWDPPRDSQKRERFIEELRYYGLLQFTPLLSPSANGTWRMQKPVQGCSAVVSQDRLNATKIAAQQGQRNSMVIGDTALTRGVHKWHVECHGLQDGRWICCAAAFSFCNKAQGLTTASRGT
eukprot:TRINITY_DN17225_c0_g1_i2.p1 TRINITY_DN17225_c0_g1~~TRINITY_DN17225_c0_g1_i2.p1  ORF type:complete len:244 (+),score=66.29 TRINITY_DN17225_c0_g1_i2:54-734(+)